MLMQKMVEAVGQQAKRNCDGCGKVLAAIEMHGYSEGKGGSSALCASCALQLARKLLEDLCELLTVGGRHG